MSGVARITPSMKLAIISFAACFVMSVAAQTKPQPKIRLVTWNMEHLAQHDGEGCRPRTEADYTALRAFIDTTFDGSSVIALQEVENAAAASRVFPADKFRVVMVDQPFPPHSNKCSGPGSGTRLPQRVGFAIGHDVSFTRNPDLDELNTSAGYPLREGADITIQTEFGSVRLLSVHLKSGCADTNSSGPDCDQLFTQIAPLESWIEARAKASQPFVILGDFNRRLSFEDIKFWNKVDDGTPLLNLRIAARHLQPSATQLCPSHPNTPFIDHLVISSSVAAHFVPGSFKQTSTRLSDHCPVELQLSVTSSGVEISR